MEPLLHSASIIESKNAFSGRWEANVTIFSLSLSTLASKKKADIMIAGLDNSGKTTLIHQMKNKQGLDLVNEIGPTVGYNIEQFSNNKVNYTVFDMSG